jgi:hypothetical protein
MTMEARGREPQPRFYSRNRLCVFINTRPALALQHIVVGMARAYDMSCLARHCGLPKEPRLHSDGRNEGQDPRLPRWAIKCGG